MTRRRLWDKNALDAAIDRKMGLVSRQDDRAARKAAWLEQRERELSENRPWIERECRKRKSGLRIAKKLERRS